MNSRSLKSIRVWNIIIILVGIILIGLAVDAHGQKLTAEEILDYVSNTNPEAAQVILIHAQNTGSTEREVRKIVVTQGASYLTLLAFIKLADKYSNQGLKADIRRLLKNYTYATWTDWHSITIYLGRNYPQYIPKRY